MSPIPPANPDEGPPTHIPGPGTPACARDEACWRGDERPRIDEFLAGLGPDEREHVRRGLEALDASLRFEGGDPPLPRDADGTSTVLRPSDERSSDEAGAMAGAEDSGPPRGGDG